MQLPDMNLLVALDALLDEGSVVGAARRMNLSPAAMSRTLTRIREAIGDPILVRAGRGLVPTPKALELREQVRDVVEEGSDPPALEDHTDEQAASREAFGTTQRRQADPEPAQQGQSAVAPVGAKGKGKTANAPAPAADQAQNRGGPAPRTYAKIAEAINKLPDGARDDALLELDGARHLPADQIQDLKAVIDRRFPQ